MTATQPDLFKRSMDPLATEPLDIASGHGEVFTQRWVVELILDLAGYTDDADLASMRLVEPACGEGAFLKVIAERLSKSCRARELSLSQAHAAVRAYDLLERNVKASRNVVGDRLKADGWPAAEVDAIVEEWIVGGDYLMRRVDESSADVIVGNPPYIRIEDVPERRMAAYRSACPTMTGRADIYVGFYDIALQSLKPGGVCAFICADRWMRNQYGRLLREKITRDYAVETVISMHDVDAFDEQVAAYPAITVLRRGEQKSVAVAETRRGFGEAHARRFAAWTRTKKQTGLKEDAYDATRLPHWFPGNDLWPTGSPARLALIEDLNDRLPQLSDPVVDVKIGIGVATGADSVFVIKDKGFIEEGRLLKLAMVRDTKTGQLQWSGNYLVNPWDETGRLVDLNDYPKLRRYLEKHQDVLKSRHTAKNNADGNWYRTIDKVNHALTDKPKLFFPDMKLVSHPVLDEGGCYPHHNLYYLSSDSWDLRVLGGLLLSKVAEAFIEAYAVRMRGRTLRFQAQYLRRIRVPQQDKIGKTDRKALIEAFEQRDSAAATTIALRLYGLDRLPD